MSGEVTIYRMMPLVVEAGEPRRDPSMFIGDAQRRIPAAPARAAARRATEDCGGLDVRAARADDRDALIACCQYAYGRERDAGRTMLVSERAYIDDYMRQADRPRLTDAEAARYRISATEPGAREQRETGIALDASGRVALIAKARASYAAEAAGRRSMVCTEDAWVNMALRDRGVPKLTAAEIATQRIAGDGFASVCAGTGSEVDQLLKTLKLRPGATPWDAALAVTDANVAGVADLLGLPAGSSLDEVRLALAQRMVGGARPTTDSGRDGETVAGSDRQHLIVTALNSYTGERVASKSVLCSPREWIDASLRDAGLCGLSAQEAQAFDLDVR